MYEYEKVKKKIIRYGATIAFVACTSPFVSYRSAQALEDSSNENTAGIESSDDSSIENTAGIESSDDSTTENTAGIESSEDSSNENTAGIESSASNENTAESESSDGSSTENTAGIESSEDSSNENTVGIESSEGSPKEDTARDESSEDVSIENTVGNESSDDSSIENTAEDDLDIYLAVLQDDFNLNKFLNKVLQDKTLDEKIKYIEEKNFNYIFRNKTSDEQKILWEDLSSFYNEEIFDLHFKGGKGQEEFNSRMEEESIAYPRDYWTADTIEETWEEFADIFTNATESPDIDTVGKLKALYSGTNIYPIDFWIDSQPGQYSGGIFITTSDGKVYRHDLSPNGLYTEDPYLYTEYKMIDDGGAERKRFIQPSEGELSEDSSNENTAGDEASDSSSNENTAGIEASEDSSNENTAGDEASEDSSNENTAGIEASEDSSNENTAGIEASEDSSNENIAGIETSEASQNENTAEDDLDIYQAVLQDDFDLNNFLDKVFQNKTLDEQIDYLNTIDPYKQHELFEVVNDVRSFINAFLDVKDDLYAQRIIRDEDNIYQAVRQEDFDLNNFLDNVLQNKTLDEKVEYLGKDFPTIFLYSNKTRDEQSELFEDFIWYKNEKVFDLHYKGGNGQEEFNNKMKNEAIEYPRDYWTVDRIEENWEETVGYVREAYMDAIVAFVPYYMHSGEGFDQKYENLREAFIDDDSYNFYVLDPLEKYQNLIYGLKEMYSGTNIHVIDSYFNIMYQGQGQFGKVINFITTSDGKVWRDNGIDPGVAMPLNPFDPDKFWLYTEYEIIDNGGEEGSSNEVQPGGETGEGPSNEVQPGGETGEGPSNEVQPGGETGEGSSIENPAGDEIGEEPTNENPAGDETGEEPTNENTAGDEIGEEPTNENPAGDETNEDPTNENPTGDESSEDSPNDNKTIKRFEDSPFGRRRFDINEDYVTVEDEDEHVSSFFELSVSGD